MTSILLFQYYQYYHPILLQNISLYSSYDLVNFWAEANIATVFIIICLQIYVYFKSKKHAYKKSLEINEGKPNNKIYTQYDIYSKHYWSFKTNILIILLIIIIETKNYYILISKVKSEVALKKDGFIKGSSHIFPSSSII